LTRGVLGEGRGTSEMEGHRGSEARFEEQFQLIPKEL